MSVIVQEASHNIGETEVTAMRIPQIALQNGFVSSPVRVVAESGGVMAPRRMDTAGSAAWPRPTATSVQEYRAAAPGL